MKSGKHKIHNKTSYTSPDPLATSSTLVYRVHDHRQTQADRVS